MKIVKVRNIEIGSNQPLVLIAGPCVIESERMTFEIAAKIKETTEELQIPFIFKTSYDKANRTSINSYRGPGVKLGIKILEKIKKKLNIPVLTDVHCRTEIPFLRDVIDVIQIPAFLSRQTDLIVEAAKTRKVINVKKGQFMSPWDIKNVCEKIESTGNKKILLTERGVSFGYRDLVFDPRSVAIMQSFGYPVVVDVTHILRPTSGEPQPVYIPVIAKAAVAAGCDAIFIETHPEPEKALSDRGSMLKLSLLKSLLIEVLKISRCVRAMGSGFD